MTLLISLRLNSNLIKIRMIMCVSVLFFFFLLFTVDLVRDHFHHADAVTHHRIFIDELILGLDLAVTPGQTTKTIHEPPSDTLIHVNISYVIKSLQKHKHIHFCIDLNVFRYVLNGRSLIKSD